MKKNLLCVMIGCVMLASITACKSKSTDQPLLVSNDEQKAGGNRDQAISFLKGIQNGDKKSMYSESNLTIELVNDSRDKLIKVKQNRISEKQRLEYEHALRVSGNIDFLVTKLAKMFPKSSVFEISGTVAKNAAADSEHFDHVVTITYNEKAEALRDKAGKQIKSLVVHLQQVDRTVNGRLIHDFSFSGKDFEKMADREFEVISYF